MFVNNLKQNCPGIKLTGVDNQFELESHVDNIGAIF